VTEFDPIGAEALAILESQLLNYRSRSSSILADPDSEATTTAAAAAASLTRVYATGGAAANKTILSLMADVLNASVCKHVEYDKSTKGWKDANWNSCSVGMAYKARWGWERMRLQSSSSSTPILFDDVVQACRERRKAARETTAPGTQAAAAVAAGANVPEEEGIRVVASPGPASAAYERSVEWWKALEKRALAEGDKAT
jgi:xylulokinase